MFSQTTRPKSFFSHQSKCTNFYPCRSRNITPSCIHVNHTRLGRTLFPTWTTDRIIRFSGNPSGHHQQRVSSFQHQFALSAHNRSIWTVKKRWFTRISAVGRREQWSSSTAEQSSFEGVIKHVTFHSEDSGWCVLKVQDETGSNVAVVGSLAGSAAEGVPIQAQGEWCEDKKYGWQFKASMITVSAPKSKEGMLKYLMGGHFTGIGPSYGRKLVEAFDTEVFDVIQNQPEKLLKVNGIGIKMQQKIVDAWKEQQESSEVLTFLFSHGVSAEAARRINKEYSKNPTLQSPSDIIAFIKQRPYALAQDITGIGFLKADNIAKSIGYDLESGARLGAGVAHVLYECSGGEGHCGLPRHELVNRATQLLQVDSSLVEVAVERELKAERLVGRDLEGLPCLFSPRLFAKEETIASKLRTLASGAPPWPKFDLEAAIDKIQQEVGLSYGPSQRNAVKEVLQSKVAVVTGGPGVGKTTILRSVIRILGEDHDVQIKLAAPTGRAARRMQESSGMSASTVHRLLEPEAGKPGGGQPFRFKRDESNPLACDFLVVDEASMLDVPLTCSLLQALPPDAALLLVGDVDQLPSVGPGRILGDIMDSGLVPVIRLTEIYRQAQDSLIVKNAHLVNSGKQLSLPSSTSNAKQDFYCWTSDDPSLALGNLMRLVNERIPQKFNLSPAEDIQVLTPRNAGGSVGAENLNKELQEMLNPAKRSSASVTKGKYTYRANDKVMYLANDYDRMVFNGDIGRVVFVDVANEQVTIEYDDGREHEYSYRDLVNVSLAYAVTIHKSQGSEYPAVVIPITMQAYMMLQRNLLYTAITRGTQLVVLVGELKAIKMAIGNNAVLKRWTMLKSLLESPP